MKPINVTENIPIELLDEAKIKSELSHPIDKFVLLESTTSTNDYLIAQVRSTTAQTMICIAEHQQAGRGRLGRSWSSPFGQNIYLSLLWKFPFDAANLLGLHIVTGIAVVEAIKTITTLPNLKLKWPNDIYIDNKKVGGVLIDIIGEYNGTCTVVIGVGLNVGMTQEAAATIEKPWTTLNQAANTPVSRNHLASVLINQLSTHLIRFTKEGLTPYLEQWRNYDYLINKSITIQSGNQVIEGLALGIDKSGSLLIKTTAGTVKSINTGDATLLSY